MSETPAEETTEAPAQVTPVPSEDSGYREAGGGVRESIRARIARRRPYSSTEVELDDGTRIEVRSITLGERAELFADLTDPETNKFDQTKMQAAIVLHASHDPETGEKVFGADDIDFIQNLDAGYIHPVVEAAQKLSGNDKPADETREDEAKKS